MTYLRHATRHIHHTVADHIEARLNTDLWTVAGQVPFGGEPVTVERTPAQSKDVGARQVRISVGNEFSPVPEEMGGPLTSQEVPVFVDVFMNTEAAAIALACDVRDALLGRTASRFIPVINQIDGTEVPGWMIEFEDVERLRPDAVTAFHWQVVKATAVVRFLEVGV